MSEMGKYMIEALKEKIFIGPVGSGKGVYFKIDQNPTAINKSCCDLLNGGAKIPSLDELYNMGTIEKQQLNNLREAFKNNENILIVGHIGSGKTTLLKSILMDEVASELTFSIAEHFSKEDAPKEDKLISHQKNYIVLKNNSGEIVRTVFNNINEHCVDAFFKYLKEGISVIVTGYNSTEFNDMLIKHDPNNRDQYTFVEVHITNQGGNHKIKSISKKII